jgi:hypothetical protein
VPDGYYLAHSISGDYSLGAGIAKRVDREYGMRRMLQATYPHRKPSERALLVSNVFNLVTKDTLHDRPTYDSLRLALEDMRAKCLLLGIRKVAMPHLSCGMDGLSWKRVRPIVYETFEGTGIEVLVCYL